MLYLAHYNKWKGRKDSLSVKIQSIQWQYTSYLITAICIL